jgi:uncharacterized protein YkwD
MDTHRRLATIVLTALAAVSAAVAITVAEGKPESTVVASAQLDPPEAEFMQLLNNYRAQNGRGPILIDPNIQAAAEWMSTDMGINNYFSHTDSTGGSPWDRMCDHGYCHNTWKGENIAAGYSSAQAVFDGWKGSPGHNANMLGEHYVVMGIALVHTPGSTYGYYWTNDFGGHNPNPNPSPPPAPTNTPTLTSTPSPTPPAPPTATATPASTATPSAAPSKAPTATPSPSPTDGPDLAADIDCDDVVTTSDVLALLHFLAGVNDDPNSTCPPVGQNVEFAGSSQNANSVKGDADCNGIVDGRDAIAVLWIAGNGASPHSGCG